VVTIHDLGYLHHPEAHTPFQRWYLDASTRFNARVATRVIVDSRATRRDLVERYGANDAKMDVVYPGVGAEFVPVTDQDMLHAARSRYGIPERYLLYVGTLQPRKNLTRLVEAYASLCQHRAAPPLVIAGKRGWLYNGLFARVEALGLATRVLFPGYLAQDDLPALLSGAIAFLMPSLYEGFGLPVLEAMACDTPVICSDVSSLPEVAGDAALLVDPLDTSAMVDAVDRLLTRPELRSELVQRGRAQVARFSWNKAADQVIDILHQTIGGR
jgi:glycosyltransferase involved in cell wall biosynthesis